MNAKEIRCRSCGGPMVKRKSARGPFYGCRRYPKCKGTQPLSDDEPLQRQASTPLNARRIQAHGIFDAWYRSTGRTRGQAYGWLQEAMHLSAPDCHIHLFEEPECMEVIRKVVEQIECERKGGE